MGQSTLSASLFLTENVNWRDNRPLRRRIRNFHLLAGKFVIKTNLCEWEKFSLSVGISIAIFDTSNWNVRIKQLRPNETEMFFEKPLKFNVNIGHATMEKCGWENKLPNEKFPVQKGLTAIVMYSVLKSSSCSPVQALFVADMEMSAWTGFRGYVNSNSCNFFWKSLSAFKGFQAVRRQHKQISLETL